MGQFCDPQHLAYIIALGVGIGAGATGKIGIGALGKFFRNGRNSQEQQVNVEIGGKVGAAAGSCAECVQNLANLFPCKGHGELLARVEFAEKQDASLGTWIGNVEKKIDAIHDGQTAMMMAMVEKGFKIQIPKRN